MALSFLRAVRFESRLLSLCKKAEMSSVAGSNIPTTAPSVASCVDSPKPPLVWMDLEMTGLNHNVDQIMEVGCLITSSDLEVISEGFEVVIHQPEEILNKMDNWCKKHHSQSGLWEKCSKSSLTLQKAEEELLAFLQKHVPKGVCPLAGNTVYMDRLFIRQYMPNVNNYMHYRIVDVSTVKELCSRWSPSVFKQAPPKVFKHRSLDDIEESIAELKFYKNYFLK